MALTIPNKKTLIKFILFLVFSSVILLSLVLGLIPEPVEVYVKFMESKSILLDLVLVIFCYTVPLFLFYYLISHVVDYLNRDKKFKNFYFILTIYLVILFTYSGFNVMKHSFGYPADIGYIPVSSQNARVLFECAGAYSEVIVDIPLYCNFYCEKCDEAQIKKEYSEIKIYLTKQKIDGVYGITKDSELFMTLGIDPNPFQHLPTVTLSMDEAGKYILTPVMGRRDGRTTTTGKGILLEVITREEHREREYTRYSMLFLILSVGIFSVISAVKNLGDIIDK